MYLYMSSESKGVKAWVERENKITAWGLRVKLNGLLKVSNDTIINCLLLIFVHI